MVLFCVYDEILSHRKWHGLTSFHSCIRVSKNLICKLLKARQKALIFCTKLSTSEKTTCKQLQGGSEQFRYKSLIRSKPFLFPLKLFKDNIKCENMGFTPIGMFGFVF